jgi:hypothetical protein
LHLGLEPASKDVSRMIGSIRQISISVTGFAVNLECESCGSVCANELNIEVQEVNSAKLMLNQCGWIGCVDACRRTLPFPLGISVGCLESCSKAAELNGRALPDQQNVVNISLVKYNMPPKFVDNGCFQPNHEDHSVRYRKGGSHGSASLL